MRQVIWEGKESRGFEVKIYKSFQRFSEDFELALPASRDAAPLGGDERVFPPLCMNLRMNECTFSLQFWIFIFKVN